MKARLLAASLALAFTAMWTAPAEATPAKINGTGSSYVSNAMQQWVADAQVNGLQVNYLPNGSPQGLTQFAQNLVDFAGTEAEYSALGNAGGADQRGYQYVPDVAGAVAIMYNVKDKAGRKVDYLHLSRETVARIFIGEISSWADPAIVQDNAGLQLPDQAITVVYRGGQSGTTALFYDFIQHTIPAKFTAWANKHQFPTQVRIIQLDSDPSFAPKTQPLASSDAIAQHIASANGEWSIGYDEGSYAQTYGVPSAWVQNASGNFVLPYAQNISAALEAAKLRPDLSQELSGVYASANPEAYPISAYSYMVTQCAAAADRATCKGPYANPGVAETLAKWMRYIACEGQVNMAKILYSPLPPHLSQELVNSIARMQGTKPETLNAQNCANPRFRGSLGAGASSPKDPLANRIQQVQASGGRVGTVAAAGTRAGANGGAAANGTTGSTGVGGAGTNAGESTGGAVGRAGGVSAVGGGSSIFRDALPVVYRRVFAATNSAAPLLMLLGLVAVPPLLLSRRRRRDPNPASEIVPPTSPAVPREPDEPSLADATVGAGRASGAI